MQDLTNELEAVTLTEQAQLSGSGMKVSHLREEGFVGSQWLARCEMGIDCSHDDSENDCDWLPSGFPSPGGEPCMS